MQISVMLCYERNRSRPLNLAQLLLLVSTIRLTASAKPKTAPFTDPASGISFQRFFGAKTGFSFGIALPENPSTDLIGRIEAPMPDRLGWAGISLQKDMVDPLLIVAWPNGNRVQSSFRTAANEDESPPVARGDFSIVEISQGTMVNDSHMTFTFLCRKCIDDGKKSFAPEDSAGAFAMGWALTDRAVSDPAEAAAVLPFHSTGFGNFQALLAQARNPQFGEWARLAGSDITSNGTTTPITAARPSGGRKTDKESVREDSDEDD